MDIGPILDRVKGKQPSAEPEPDPNDPNEAAEGGDHAERIKAAMDKIKEGMAELEECINEY